MKADSRFRCAFVLLAGALLAAATAAAALSSRQAATNSQNSQLQPPQIQAVNPPEDGFFTKELSFHGIIIKAPAVVDDEALYALYDRLARDTAHLPVVVENLAAAGAEFHIIGRNQVTTDLPEWRQDKHVPLDEYGGLTRDQRTRGMGGLITSCAEENLLNLPSDRYRGRDICTHEFAHNIEFYGIQPEVRALFDKQYQISKAKGLWLNSYAGSNPAEYFAELTMWYFGTHGDLTMTGSKPENGPEGLKKYDPDAYKLLDDFYSGRITVTRLAPRPRPNFAAYREHPRDSLLARAVVAHLASYKVGETTLTEFFSDAGMASPSDFGANGWRVVRVESPAPDANTPPANGAGAAGAPSAAYHFRVFFRYPPEQPAVTGASAPPAGASPAQPQTVAQNASASGGQPSGAQAGTRQRPRFRFRRYPRYGGDHLIADVEFSNGVLSGFHWDN